MGIRIKHIKIKPGTFIWEGVHFSQMNAPDEEIKPDKNGWCWTKVFYAGADINHQWFFTYLYEYWPNPKDLEIITNQFPANVHDDFFFEGLYPKLEADEGLIGYDFKPSGICYSEYVGEIKFLPLDINPYA